MDQSEILARFDILKLSKDVAPGVRLTAFQDFMDMPPLQRAIMIGAVVHLCFTAIDAIMRDHPDDADDIGEVLASLSIEPSNEGTIN
jgi:hypothetical protein